MNEKRGNPAASVTQDLPTCKRCGVTIGDTATNATRVMHTEHGMVYPTCNSCADSQTTMTASDESKSSADIARK